MAHRKRIGLTFSYNEQWIAGSYYILNIIHALNLLDPAKKPVVVIISEEKKNFELVQQETHYPFLEFFKFPVEPPSYSKAERLMNKVGSVFGMKKLISKKPLRLQVDLVYPFEVEKLTELPLKKINWVPDFQEVHLPHLFQKQELLRRKRHQQEIICKGDWVVFSSKDSQRDFNNLYSKATVEQYVLPFAVTHPNFESEDFQKLLKKYRLPEKYYFAPNQFWAHKNHMVILRALKRVKAQGYEVYIAFSGREDDHRNADYVAELKQYISENGLAHMVRFLGFIPRTEQLKLMKESIAIVQTSKFEGWSTVVEDAKALGQFLILSNLKVHLEQIDKNVSFFDVDNDEHLAELLMAYWRENPEYVALDYQQQQIKFAKNILDFIDKVTEA